MRAGAWWSLATLLASAASGCAAIGNYFREPEFRLERVVVRGIDLTGGTMDLLLDVYNPNRYNLQGTRLRLGFEVEKSHVGDVEYADDFAVQQSDTTRLTLPLSFQWSGVGSAVRAALGYGEIPYTMKGEATLRTPWGEHRVPFSAQGRVPLARVGARVALPAGR